MADQLYLEFCLLRGPSPPPPPDCTDSRRCSLAADELDSRRSASRDGAAVAAIAATSPPTELFRLPPPLSGLIAIGGLETFPFAAAVPAADNLWPVKVEKVGAAAGGLFETSSPSPPSGRPRDWNEVGSSSSADELDSTGSSRTKKKYNDTIYSDVFIYVLIEKNVNDKDKSANITF